MTKEKFEKLQEKFESRKNVTKKALEDLKEIFRCLSNLIDNMSIRSDVKITCAWIEWDGNNNVYYDTRNHESSLTVKIGRAHV